MGNDSVRPTFLSGNNNQLNFESYTDNEDDEVNRTNCPANLILSSFNMFGQESEPHPITVRHGGILTNMSSGPDRTTTLPPQLIS